MNNYFSTITYNFYDSVDDKTLEDKFTRAVTLKEKLIGTTEEENSETTQDNSDSFFLFKRSKSLVCDAAVQAVNYLQDPP